MKKTIVTLLLIICITASDAQYGAFDSAAIIKPFKIFDNLYYVGNTAVSAYLIKTTRGLILVDALYGKDTAYPIAATRQLGFSEKDIKYILCTHAHFDHCEGAAFIKKMTGATIGMTAPDWEIATGNVKAPYTSVNNTTERDWTIKDGDSLTLGNTTIYFYQTPGHTPGVLSIRFPVWDGSKQYTAFMFGGVGLNFDGVERTEMYLKSVDRIRHFKNVEVNISNHPGPGQVFERANRLAVRKPNEAHPFVDPEGFQRWLTGLNLAAEKKLAEEKKKGAAGTF